MSKYAPGYTGPTTTAGPAKPTPKKPLMPKKPVIKATGMAMGGAVNKTMPVPLPKPKPDRTTMPMPLPKRPPIDGLKPLPKRPPMDGLKPMPIEDGKTTIKRKLPSIKPTGMAKGGTMKKGMAKGGMAKKGKC
jgi:hypothetical protein